MKNKVRRNRRSKWLRRGTTAVEFAVAGPALLLIIFLCCEFARMSMMKSLAQDAAYDSARFCMVEGATEAEAIQKANDVLSLLGTQDASVEINDGLGITDRNTIKVDVSIPMYENSFVVPLLYYNRFINATMELRVEKYEGFYDDDDDN